MVRRKNSSVLSVRSTRGKPRSIAKRSKMRVTGKPPSALAGTTAGLLRRVIDDSKQFTTRAIEHESAEQA